MKPSFAPVTERHRGGSVGAARPTGVSMRSQAMRPLAAAGLVPALRATQHSAVATRHRPTRCCIRLTASALDATPTSARIHATRARWQTSGTPAARSRFRGRKRASPSLAVGRPLGVSIAGVGTSSAWMRAARLDPLEYLRELVDVALAEALEEVCADGREVGRAARAV